MSETAIKPRDDRGRFLALFCDDLNCCGALVLDGGGWSGPGWQCDGLTYDRDDGPLRACTRWYPAPFDALTRKTTP